MNLNQYREEKGLSYGKLAEMLGFSKSYVWQICRKPEILRISDINKIAEVLGNEVDFRSLIKEQ